MKNVRLNASRVLFGRVLARVAGGIFGVAAVIALSLPAHAQTPAPTKSKSPAPLARAEILVFAAASTTDALTEIARAYEADSGQKVLLSLGGSSALAKQIIAGAPADVFLSADLTQMERLEKAGLVKAAERKPLLSNSLVVIVPASLKDGPAGLQALLTAKTIGLADPETVPVGVYTRQWLEAKGQWAAIKPRVIPLLDVRATLAAVEAGRVDVGVVYRTDALLSKKVRVVHEVVGPDAPRIIYPVAPVAASKHKAQADAFTKYLSGAKAKATFARFGFPSTEPALREPALREPASTEPASREPASREPASRP